MGSISLIISSCTLLICIVSYAYAIIRTMEYYQALQIMQQKIDNTLVENSSLKAENAALRDKLNVYGGHLEELAGKLRTVDKLLDSQEETIEAFKRTVTSKIAANARWSKEKNQESDAVPDLFNTASPVAEPVQQQPTYKRKFGELPRTY